MPSTMRLFVAVNLPPAIRDAIYADAAALRSATSAVKWTAAPALHVTLKFLGEQDDRVVGEFSRAITMVAARHEPFDVHTTAPGAFPNFRRPRVVWVGLTGEAALSALARDIDLMFAGFGIGVELRAFKAHLTLGRSKGEMKPDDARTLAAAAEASHPTRAFAVRTVDLMRSELGPGGSRYSVLAAVPLHARGT